MMDYKSLAIFELYPSVVSYRGTIPQAVAYDQNNLEVAVDMAQVEQEAINMEAEDIAQAEAKELIRQSLISKLSATLTPEETALLEELL